MNATYRPNKHVKGRPECTIFVSRLNQKTTKQTIQEIFSRYGRIKRFRMVRGGSLGVLISFITFIFPVPISLVDCIVLNVLVSGV